MATPDQNQLSLFGIPQATYTIRVYCGRCGHMSELTVGIKVLHSLYRLGCSQCGAGIKDLKVEQMQGLDLGG